MVACTEVLHSFFDTFATDFCSMKEPHLSNARMRLAALVYVPRCDLVSILRCQSNLGNETTLY